MTTIEKGVLDRIEDGLHAVIIVESLQQEFIIAASKLPPDAKEGMYFEVSIKDGDIVHLTFDQQETALMKESIEEQLKRLQAKSGKSRFKRN